MSDTVEWSAFYRTLNRLGPRLLQGVDPALEGLILDEARDSDAFWSGSLEAEFETWAENPERAIKYALRVWASNVRRYLQDFLRPESLFPFESMGITSGDRRQFIASLKSIRFRLDRQHLRLFMDSVLIGTAETVDSPILLVQGLIEPYRKTTEGTLIRASQFHGKLSSVTSSKTGLWRIRSHQRSGRRLLPPGSTVLDMMRLS